jgi:NDP-sugar pyrophosphorylase family protein
VNDLPAVAILAGGLATRLRPFSEKLPKALIDVGGRPFVFHLLELLRGKGITQAVLCVGHLGQQIADAVGDGSKLGLRVKYSFDGSQLLGTGGALRRAASLVGDPFFVLNGDTFLDCDYRAAYAAFEASGKPGLMAIHRNRGQGEASNVWYVEGRIRSYDKVNRTASMEHVDCGLGILRGDAIRLIPVDRAYDLADLYQSLLRSGDLAAYEVSEPYHEIGSPEGILETERYFQRRLLPTLKPGKVHDLARDS